ncbi:MAG: alkaline phosphatase family protein [Acidobacteriota bacterium]
MIRRGIQLLTCALIGSLLFTATLVQLFELLNPARGWTMLKRVQFAAVLYWPYGVALVAATVLGFEALQFLAGRKIRLGWAGMPVVAWILAAQGALTVGLFVRNAFLYRAFVSDETYVALMSAVIAWILVVLAMCLLGAYHYFYPETSWRKTGAAVLGTAALALIGPLLTSPASGRTGRESARLEPIGDLSAVRGRVILLGLDGGSLNYVLPLISQGRLPHFQTLIERGAGGRLRTITPTVSRALWATVLTGKSPARNGVFGEYQFDFDRVGLVFDILPRGLFFHSLLERTGALRARPADATERSSVCYWDFFLRDSGLRAGVVDMWAPLLKLNGFIAGNPAFSPDSQYVPAALRGVADGVAVEARADAQTRVDAMLGGSEIAEDQRWRTEILRRALLGDEFVSKMSGRLDADVIGLRFRGLDLITHYFPAAFAGDNYRAVGEATEVFERTTEQYYRFCDEVLGTYLDSLPPDTLLCVVSVHGMDPVPAWLRMIELLRDRPPQVAAHDGGPDGFFFLYGRDIAGGVSIGNATLYDILPTLLYYHRLPVGLDMEGRILLEAFRRTFKETNPASYVPTHEAP